MLDGGSFACADEYPSLQGPENNETGDTRLMTPAKRAALDALEREFEDLLKATQR